MPLPALVGVGRGALEWHQHQVERQLGRQAMKLHRVLPPERAAAATLR